MCQGIGDLELALDREGQLASKRFRASAELANNISTLAARVSSAASQGPDSAVRDMSVVARDIIRKVGEQSTEHKMAREEAARNVAQLRASIAGSVQECEDTLGEGLTLQLLDALLEMTTLESVFEVTGDVAESRRQVDEFINAADRDARTVAATVPGSIDAQPICSTAHAAGASMASMETEGAAAAESRAIPLVDVEVQVEVEETGLSSGPATTTVAPEPQRGQQVLLIDNDGSANGVVVELSGDEADVADADKDVTWSVVVLKILDVAFFVLEELAKAALVATPYTQQVLSTAVERALWSIGDGSFQLGTSASLRNLNVGGGGNGDRIPRKPLQLDASAARTAVADGEGEGDVENDGER